MENTPVPTSIMLTTSSVADQARCEDADDPSDARKEEEQERRSADPGEGEPVSRTDSGRSCLTGRQALPFWQRRAPRRKTGQRRACCACAKTTACSIPRSSASSSSGAARARNAAASGAVSGCEGIGSAARSSMRTGAYFAASRAPAFRRPRQMNADAAFSATKSTASKSSALPAGCSARYATMTSRSFLLATPGRAVAFCWELHTSSRSRGVLARGSAWGSGGGGAAACGFG
jgi:hypothetical protein